jgi:hypothetical protein
MSFFRKDLLLRLFDKLLIEIHIDFGRKSNNVENRKKVHERAHYVIWISPRFSGTFQK